MGINYGKLALQALLDSYFLDCAKCGAVVLETNVSIDMCHSGFEKRWVMNIKCWCCEDGEGSIVVSYPRNEIVEIDGDLRFKLRNDLDAAEAIAYVESILATSR